MIQMKPRAIKGLALRETDITGQSQVLNLDFLTSSAVPFLIQGAFQTNYFSFTVDMRSVKQPTMIPFILSFIPQILIEQLLCAKHTS